MKRVSKAWLWILVTALALAACNQEGVGAFSPNNDRVAIVSKVGDKTNLYTTDSNGGNVAKIVENVAIGFDTSFDPVGSKILYAAGSQICTANAGGGGQSCPVTLPAGVSSGFLSFLPNGDYILVVSSSGKWRMEVRQPGALVPYRVETDVDAFFLTEDAYKVKRGSNGTEWYLTPYLKPSGQQNLRWVIVRGSQAFMYNAAGSLEGPTPLPRPINTAVANALKDRDQTDITSGVVSPDGTKMVFRTRIGTSPNFTYGLYALDLATTEGSFVQLVSNANFRIRFAYSPTGAEVVYESNADGRSVWIANADGSNQRKLADNASLPGWR
jgi:Tol biopolymer transport system component